MVLCDCIAYNEDKQENTGFIDQPWLQVWKHEDAEQGLNE